MQYILKVRCNSASLSEVVKQALLKEYGVQATLEEVGTLCHGGGKLVWLEATGNKDQRIDLVAKGYDEEIGWSPKYRVYGHLMKYCPKCDVSRALSTEGLFCSSCGTRYQHEM